MSSGRRPATIVDVAARAGVSTATVSRVMSGSRGVRTASAESVRSAARDLDYRPNVVGQTLRRQASRAVGMVVPRVDNPFFPAVVQAAEQALRKEGYALLLCTSGDDPEVERQVLDMLVGRQVDGLLISPCRREASRAAVVRSAARVPLVQVDRRVDGAACDFVGVDDARGLRDVLRHVAGAGARSVAYVGGDDSSWSGKRRHEAFLAAVKGSRRARSAGTLLGSFTAEWGREAGRRLLEGELPDAVVCGNDLIAVGVLAAVDEARLRVPGDVLVTGFDDIGVAGLCRPGLTTVRQPVGALTREAVRLLLARVAEPDRPPGEALLRTTLIERQSTLGP